MLHQVGHQRAIRVSIGNVAGHDSRSTGLLRARRKEAQLRIR